MEKIDELYNEWKQTKTLTNTQIKELYLLSPKLYDYENHKYNEKINEILQTRNIKEDLAKILNCVENEIAFPSDNMNMNHLYLYDGLHITNLYTHEVINGKRENITKYRDYKPKEDKIDELKKKSIIPNSPKIPFKYAKKKIDPTKLKEQILGTVLAVSVVATTIGSVVISGDNHKMNLKVAEYIKNNSYIVTDAKRRTDDSQGYYYLHSKMAKEVVNSNEDKEALIYVVYKNVSQDAATINGHNQNQIDYNMDLFIQNLSLCSDDYNYSTFDNYLIDRNFVQENNKVDIPKYNDEMCNYIYNLQNNKEITNDGGKTY